MQLLLHSLPEIYKWHLSHSPIHWHYTNEPNILSYWSTCDIIQFNLVDANILPNCVIAHDTPILTLY